MGAPQQTDSHPSGEQLRDFNLGRLSDDEALALGRHLEGCAVCCQALQNLPDDPFLVRLRGAAPAARSGPVPLPELTDFEIVRELGRGGMGVVYEAEQLSLKRRVAVKVLPARLNEGAALERFRRESRVAGRLHHTNVVPVFEVGHEGDVWFYVMQLIPGHSLDRVIARSRGAGRAKDSDPRDTRTYPRGPGPTDSTLHPNTPVGAAQSRAPSTASDTVAVALSELGSQEVARIGLQVAEAVAYAHARGVLHRDIKPSNLLLDDSGTVWVTDFGLAKSENENLTGPGAVVGTLRYMAPERFGGACDPRADVYGLGCTLYELLALRPAFDAAGTAEVVRQVLEGAPPLLRTRNAAVPRDLETIIHKAMDRDPARRYQSAQELADDLRRFLAGLPTRARPPGSLEHLARWGRRNKGLAVALVVITALVLAGLTGLGIATAEFRGQAEAQRKLTGEAETERAKAEQATEEAGRALRRAETTLTDLYASHGLIAGERGDAPRAALWFANAARLAVQDPDRARINRVRAQAWARQATLPVRALGHDENLRLLSFRPGTGDLLLTVTDSRRYRVWDWNHERPLPWADGGQTVLATCWSPDGRWLALGFAGAVEVRAVPSGEVAHRLSRRTPVTALAFSPDSRFLATTGGGLDIYDCLKKEFTGPIWVPTTRIRTLTFGPHGDRLAVTLATGDNQVRMFAVTNGRLGDKPLYEPFRHDTKRNRLSPFQDAEEPLPPVFINDGRALVTIGDKKLSQWDTETGRSAGPDLLVTEINALDALVAAPEGRAFAAAGDGGIHGPKFWSATESGLSETLCEHANRVSALAFSPNGRELLSTSWDRTARLWAVPSGRPVGHPLPHQDTVYNAAYSPDGLHLATGQRGGLVRVWRRPPPGAGDRTVPLFNYALRLKPSNDGRFVIPGKFGGEYHKPMSVPALGVYETTSGAPIGPTFALGNGCADAAVSGDGSTAAAVLSRDTSRTLHLWNPRTGQRVADAITLPGAPTAVAFNADDSRVGVLCDTGAVLLFDPQTGREVLRSQLEGWRSGKHQSLFLAFAPPKAGSAEGTIVVAHADGSVRIIGEATGAARCAPIRGPKTGGSCGTFRIAPDGRHLAIAWRGAHAVQVFDLHSGAALSEPLPHPDTVYDICFTPDGARVFTGCRDGQARLWDWKAPMARQVCPPCAHPDEVYSVAVTSDGLWGLTACRKGNKSATGSVHFWEFTTGKPAAPPVHFAEGSVNSVVVAPDGTRALTIVEAHGLRSLSLNDMSGPAEMGPDALCALAELASSQRLYKGDVAGLGTDEWLALWRAFRQQYPTYGGSALADPPPAPAPAPGDARAQWVLADAHGRKCEWQRAADALGRAPIPVHESWHWQWYCLGTLLAETGDREAYRRTCRAMLEHFGGTQNPEIAERVAKTCLLVPGVLDPEPIDRLCDRALALGKRPEHVMWFHAAKALAEYRQGRFEGAIAHLEASRKINASKALVYLEALDLFLLAMACKRLGADDDADCWFAQAQKQMDALSPRPGADLRSVWQDYLITLIVRREAEALFRDHK